MDAASRNIESKAKACDFGFSSTIAFLSSKATIALTAPASFSFHYAGQLRTQTYSFEETPERPTTYGSRQETYSTS